MPTRRRDEPEEAQGAQGDVQDEQDHRTQRDDGGVHCRGVAVDVSGGGFRRSVQGETATHGEIQAGVGKEVLPGRPDRTAPQQEGDDEEGFDNGHGRPTRCSETTG